MTKVFIHLPDAALLNAMWAEAERCRLEGSPESRARADELFQKIISTDPASELAEQARTRRTEFAHQAMREAAGPLNMAAVFYMLAVMQKFEKMTVFRSRQVGLEVALLGRRGFDMLDPTPKYHLHSEEMEGTYSGLYCVSILYVCVRQMSKTESVGCDLEAEYAAACELYELDKARRKA